jgi:hypothetical protein
MKPLELRFYGLEIRPHLLRGYAVFQTRYDQEVVHVVHRAMLGREGDRHPELLCVHREVEPGRHHAEDGVRLAVQADVAPEDRGVGPEGPLP